VRPDNLIFSSSRQFVTPFILPLNIRRIRISFTPKSKKLIPFLAPRDRRRIHAYSAKARAGTIAKGYSPGQRVFHCSDAEPHKLLLCRNATGSGTSGATETNLNGFQGHFAAPSQPGAARSRQKFTAEMTGRAVYQRNPRSCTCFLLGQCKQGLSASKPTSDKRFVPDRPLLAEFFHQKLSPGLGCISARVPWGCFDRASTKRLDIDAVIR